MVRPDFFSIMTSKRCLQHLGEYPDIRGMFARAHSILAITELWAPAFIRAKNMNLDSRK
jgi:hypothetical protein